ncbi:MAG TPA: hypothetical protein VJU80_01250 [Solirubrobacteraceae bacterium]|nr:hypothetical protein [Solirubrobacteraceae bacterium]
MGTAPKKSRAARQLATPVRDVRVPESMEFLVFEDNGGDYRWRIVAGDVVLAQSESVASCNDAEHAARRIRDGAASARFDQRGAEFSPVDLATRRDRPGDELDAERWLDEGGSFREATARWPDQR